MKFRAEYTIEVTHDVDDAVIAEVRTYEPSLRDSSDDEVAEWLCLNELSISDGTIDDDVFVGLTA